SRSSTGTSKGRQATSVSSTSTNESKGWRVRLWMWLSARGWRLRIGTRPLRRGIELRIFHSSRAGGLSRQLPSAFGSGKAAGTVARPAHGGTRNRLGRGVLRGYEETA